MRSLPRFGQGRDFAPASFPSAYLLLAVCSWLVVIGCTQKSQHGEVDGIEGYLDHVWLEDTGDVYASSQGQDRLVLGGGSDVRAVAIGPEEGSVIVEVDDGVRFRRPDGTSSEIASGRLFASSRDGSHVAVGTGGEITVLTVEGLVAERVTCPDSRAAAWNRDGNVLGLVCGQRIVIYSQEEKTMAAKTVDVGVPLDITVWGDGFALLVDAGGGRALYRTPLTSVQQFGFLGDLPPDVDQIVGGAATGGLLVRTIDGRAWRVELGEDLVEIHSRVEAIAHGRDD